MKISALSLEEVNNQLQILEYIETNTPKRFSDRDRILRRSLEEQAKRLKAQAPSPEKE